MTSTQNKVRERESDSSPTSTMRNLIMRRRKTEKSSPDEVSVTEEEAVKYLQDVEDRFRTLLSPVEAYIMGIQSTLVWEIPSFSAFVFLAVNIVFWLATRMRFYHLFGLTGLTVVFLDIWIHKIWPEIRVPPSPNEDQEEWTIVHPKLLGVPEISRHLARFWLTASGAVHWFIILRSTSHARFFVAMMLLLIVIGIIGLYVSGIMLLYIIVMSVFIIPPLIYYNMLDEFYKLIEPTIMKVEKMLNVKRTRSKKSKRKKKADGGEEEVVSDSDEGLEDFVPESATLKPSLLKATNNESEEESTGHTPGLLTPDALSQGPSRDISDTESNGDEATMSFTKGLKKIPDFDDSRLDDSLNDDHENLTSEEDLLPDVEGAADEQQNDVLPVDEMPAPTEISQSESMQFVPGHFKDSSESDKSEADIETELGEGLAFPDIQDELDTMAKEETSSNAAIATELVSKTVSSLMTSTMSGLSRLGETASRLGETVRSAAKSATSGEPGEEDAGDVAEGAASVVQPTDDSKRKTITESTDSDILAEFEFLEQEDLDVLDDEGKKAPTDTVKDEPESSPTKKADDDQ